MKNNQACFETGNSFGVKVLLKLTSNCIKGIKIFQLGSRYASNVSADELNAAVSKTIERHNIQVKVG